MASFEDFQTKTLVLAVLIEIDGKTVTLEGTKKNILKRLSKDYKRNILQRQLERILKELKQKSLIVTQKGLLKSKETIYRINPRILENRAINCWIALGIEAVILKWPPEKLFLDLMDAFARKYGDSIATVLKTLRTEET